MSDEPLVERLRTARTPLTDEAADRIAELEAKSGDDDIAVVDLAAYIVTRRKEGLVLAERLAAWVHNNEVKCIADTIEYLRREE